MRILYISNNFPLISETFVIYEIADLIRAGADVRILSLTKPSLTMRSSLPTELGFEDRIFYRQELKKSKWSKLWRILLMKLKGIAIPRGKYDISRYQLMEIASCLNDMSWQADILHCHFGPVGRLGAIMKKAGIISSLVTTTFHGFDVSQILKEKNPDYYDGLFATGDHFFSINDYYLKIIHGLGAPVEKTSLFHMGVDCNGLPFYPRSCPLTGITECISVGRMTEKKGFETTIRAFAYTAISKSDMHLHLVGDGPLMGEMKALASSLDVAAQITFHGALQHEEVKELLVRTHIFLLPSTTAQSGDMEGIPVALMEAMAMGIPVFSTFHSGIPELIEDGISGFLIQEKDYISLAGKLVYLLDHPEIWQDITLAARRKVETDFNRKVQSQILFDMFNNLVKNFHA